MELKHDETETLVKSPRSDAPLQNRVQHQVDGQVLQRIELLGPTVL